MVMKQIKTLPKLQWKMYGAYKASKCKYLKSGALNQKCTSEEQAICCVRRASYFLGWVFGPTKCKIIQLHRRVLPLVVLMICLLKGLEGIPFDF